MFRRMGTETAVVALANQSQLFLFIEPISGFKERKRKQAKSVNRTASQALYWNQRASNAIRATGNERGRSNLTIC